MKHSYFCDGNKRKISWVIKNEEMAFNQIRDHAEIYLDKLSIEQSKYVALHVGIFWGIGRFIIKNDVFIKIMLDQKPMYEHLTGMKQNNDKFIQSKTNFIKQLIEQRCLQINFEFIRPDQNLASKLLTG